MPSKLVFDELNFVNCKDKNHVYQVSVPSYQLPTIASQLKTVVRGYRFNRSGIHSFAPFAVGTSFITHNVKLLKQETLKKLKLFLFSYKNEDEINCSNINELRLLKFDIDCFHMESQTLKSFALRKRRKFVNLPNDSRYAQNIISANKSREPLIESSFHDYNSKKKSSVPNDDEDGQELSSLLQLKDQLECIFKAKKVNVISDNKDKKAPARKICTKAGKPSVEFKQLQNKFNKVDDNHYIPDNVNSLVSLNCDSSSKYSSRRKRKKKKIRYINQNHDIESEINNDKEDCRISLSDLKNFNLIEDSLGENITSVNIAPHQQDSNQINSAPSSYKRKKKRVKHVVEGSKYSTNENEKYVTLSKKLPGDCSDSESVSTLRIKRKTHMY